MYSLDPVLITLTTRYSVAEAQRPEGAPQRASLVERLDTLEALEADKGASGTQTNQRP